MAEADAIIQEHIELTAEIPTCDGLEPSVAQDWLDVEEHATELNIFEIVESRLLDVKKLKMPAAQRIKVVMQLTAVTQYVQLQDRFRDNPNCTRPCLNASLVIARRMGKKDGAYFARQIRHNEIYLLRHRRLPVSKKGAKNGQYTLLDNEAIIHSVRRYLAAQNLGTITPKELCRHVNLVILPSLDLSEKNGSICERTAVNWLKKLGYVCKDVKKGVYHDGHKRPDVVAARKKFLDELQKYDQYVIFPCLPVHYLIISH